MSELGILARRPATWLSEPAPERDIVLSSRVRLARNVAGQTFPASRPADELCEVRSRVLEAVRGGAALTDARVLHMEDLEDLERRFLLERHLISLDLVRYVLGRSLVVSEDESCGLMVNEEDHLRLQVFGSGLAPERALERALEVARSLERELRFAYDARLGYLTACPTNVGTGMRASILVHLPCLVLTGDVERVLNSLRRLDYTVRGFYGEGSGVLGALFQISNARTLGLDEVTIARELVRHTREVIGCERAAREALLARDRARLEDRAWRAWALLHHARLLTTREAFDLLGDVRLGACAGILPSMDESILNALVIRVQGAHLQIAAGRSMDTQERDVARAAFVREQLQRAAERSEDR